MNVCLKLSYYNEYKSYLRLDEDVVTSKISPVNLFDSRCYINSRFELSCYRGSNKKYST